MNLFGRAMGGALRYGGQSVPEGENRIAQALLALGKLAGELADDWPTRSGAFAQIPRLEYRNDCNAPGLCFHWSNGPMVRWSNRRLVKSEGRIFCPLSEKPEEPLDQRTREV